MIETQGGDVSASPTNVISITNDQIYLEADLFNSGIRPAINVGLSVSRVGGNAQIKAMRRVAGSLRSISRNSANSPRCDFSSDQLDNATQAQLAPSSARGNSEGGQFQPLPVEEQVLVIFAGTTGLVDDLPVASVQAFEKGLINSCAPATASCSCKSRRRSRSPTKPARN